MWSNDMIFPLLHIDFQSESLLQQKAKEQEVALTKETLLIINDMRMKFPGKTDEESELIIEDVSIYEKERE